MKLATLISIFLHLVVVGIIVWSSNKLPVAPAYAQVYSVDLVESMPFTDLEPVVAADGKSVMLEPVALDNKKEMQESNVGEVDGDAPELKKQPASKPKPADQEKKDRDRKKKVEATEDQVAETLDRVEEEEGTEAQTGESDNSLDDIKDVTNIGQIRLEGEEFKFPYYLNLIIYKVRSRWKNPHSSRLEPLSVTIFFRILESGELVNPAVESSSGSAFFDRAAIRAIASSSPLPPLPDEFAGDNLGVHLEFIHEPILR